MPSSWWIQLSIGEGEVSRVLGAQARTRVAEALNAGNVTLGGWVVRPPTRVEFVVHVPADHVLEAMPIADRVRDVLGLEPGLTDAKSVEEADVAGIIDVGLRGAAGRGLVCLRCGRLDGHHAEGCPDNARRPHGERRA
ncbi:hypothetical protein [Paractinoplanes globisporus]|uniref:CCHC-type domain-containing protein n=1 Tax=Paractinoplanes globisporus TaxID=113565 RepID=A0ABW6WIG1_9ACTN|nr:hypothetical protein [Actinoplanes globisporus]